MKKVIIAVLGFLAVAVLVAACGSGGGSSSSTHNERSSLAESSEAEAHRQKKQEQAHESLRQERREEKENREFKEQEEARIRKEEAERKKQKEKVERKHRKPKPEPAPSDVDPIAAEEFHSFTGTDRENWEIAYEVCGSTPEKQLAREFHTEDNWAAIGHAYGSEEYREPFNIAPEEGCMAALMDSRAQWEATLEELPFKEL